MEFKIWAFLRFRGSKLNFKTVLFLLKLEILLVNSNRRFTVQILVLFSILEPSEIMLTNLC